jgi:biopolymer transport protein ExbB/TolQ
LATKIYRLKIGDVILLILIAIIIISLINMNKKFRRLTPDKFKEMKADLERMQRNNEALMNSANNVIAINKELRSQNEAIKKSIINLKSEIDDKIKKELEQVLNLLELLVRCQMKYIMK